ncbi:MAG: Uma2 family endonuclease [Isosphaeraceae bacterium]
MATVAQKRATLDDLYRTPEKAELIGGRIVHLMSTGRKPGRVGGRIYRSLDDYSQQNGGEAFPDNVGYAVPLLPSGRESFAPDASWHKGPFPTDPMRFIEGAPTCAVEVRSGSDFGPAAEAEMADKRADYFQAGTVVVWDVDPIAECVHVYRAGDPEHAVTYRRGDTAEAEPAVPGWSVAVDWIFS